MIISGNLIKIKLNLSQASAQNSESDNQKEEKLVMEKKIAELEDKLRVRLAERRWTVCIDRLYFSNSTSPLSTLTR